MSDEVKARTRKNRMRRRGRIEVCCVGDDKFPLDCPRCGEPCTHLVVSYYESPWNDLGGKCGQCCADAVAHYEANDCWPKAPWDKDEVLDPEAEQGEMFD